LLRHHADRLRIGRARRQNEARGRTTRNVASRHGTCLCEQRLNVAAQGRGMAGVHRRVTIGSRVQDSPVEATDTGSPPRATTSRAAASPAAATRTATAAGTTKTGVDADVAQAGQAGVAGSVGIAALSLPTLAGRAAASEQAGPEKQDTKEASTAVGKSHC